MDLKMDIYIKILKEDLFRIHQRRDPATSPGSCRI